jgi:D-alanyl-D-alanine endopeptidase (penicillin-binding protein 7)
VIFERDADVAAPIASITKLMLAMVVLDANLDPNEPIKIVREDKPQTSKFTRSPLTFGMVITRENLLRVALMASDNRAAESLARTFPGGTAAAIAAMNRKAAELGLTATRFEDPTGLDAGNVSTAHELSTLVAAARSYPLICEYTTTRELDVRTSRGTLKFINTDVLLRRKDWSIDLSKTGYINEAGRCLVLHATIAERPMTVVLLGANGKYTAVADASRLRAWLEPGRVAPKAPPKGKTGERSP